MNNLKWLRKLRAEELALWLVMRMIDSNDATYKDWLEWLKQNDNDGKFSRGRRCPHCGGPLSEVRVQNGKQLWHCYSCHFEYYKGGAG